MAKIDISYDTISKEIFTTIDGAPIPETDYISFETYNGQNRMYLSFKTVEVDGMNINTRVEAKSFEQENYILTTSDGHMHYYVSSSPFTSTNDGHFHGVVGDEVISSDDHTHSLIKLDNVEDVHIPVEERLLGFIFELNGKNNIYFKTDSGIKLGSWTKT